jgi:hypothetical protein
MPAPVDRSEVLELQFANPRARTPEVLAHKAQRAMRRPPPPDATSALQASGDRRETGVARALRYLRHEQPELAAAFDESSLRASAASERLGCRWCLAQLIASVHSLPPVRLSPQNAALLGGTCPNCPATSEAAWRRRKGLPPALPPDVAAKAAARRAVRMVRAALYASQPRRPR